MRLSSLMRCIGLGAVVTACTAPGSGQTAWVGATVIDGAGRVIPDAVLIVDSGRVVAVGPRDSVDTPRGAEVVDVGGRWIIPGLIEGHAHAGESSAARYLSYGVTSLRHVGGNLESLTSLSARIAADSLPGPRLYLAGETLTGAPAVWPGQVVLDTPTDADAAVSRLAAAGVSQVKLYTHTTQELMGAVVEAARKHNIPVTAHLGYVDAMTAARLGVDALEHLSGVVEATVADPTPFYRAHDQFPNGWMTFLRGWARLDSASLDRVATFLAGTRVTLVPTLVQSETYARVLDSTYAGSLDLTAVTAAEREAWDLPDLVRRYGITRNDMEPLAQARRWQELFLRRFVANEGRVVAGSDSPNQLLAPGASLHEELKLLVRSGLTAGQALDAATAGAARLLRADSIGVLRAGAVADFVVLQADPLADIRNVQRVESVVARGRPHAPLSLRGQSR